MMASVFSAGAVLLLAAMAAPQTTPREDDARVLRQIRVAAAQTAHDDAQAYLEQERRERKATLIMASADDARPWRDLRLDPFSAR